MSTQSVVDIASAKKYVEDNDIRNIKLAVTDIDGVMRGKYVNQKKFFSALEKGLGFCDVIFGWDSDDQLYSNDSYTGWKDAFPDAWANVDGKTCRALPCESEDSILFICDFSKQSHLNVAEIQDASSVCPRSILKKVINRLESLGLKATASAEFEFFVFDETPDSIRDKNFDHLKPFTPGNFGYSILRNSTHADIYHDLMSLCERMNMPLEGLHTETGPGVLEAALQYSDLLSAADNAVLFKTFSKVMLQQQGLMATFMAKWSKEHAGQSGHLHMALQNDKGDAIFYDPNRDNNMSQEMMYFIGGQQQLMPEFLAMVALTCNSYTRLIPGYWAPTDASWGIDNRTCAIRAIPADKHSQRVEYRVSAADINPYLALAAAIGSGIWGIENKIEPSKPIQGNAYAVDFPKNLQLPRTLTEAAEKLSSSAAANELFGEEFVKHFCYTRKWEDQQQRKAITNWQLNRYFEII